MRRMPLLSILLGLCSPIPLIILSLGIIFSFSIHPGSFVWIALVSYGALMLAFPGGIHWGLGMQQSIILPARAMNSFENWRLFLSILPGILGWIALMLTANQHALASIFLLMFSFIMVLFFERKAQRLGETPSGYLALRWVITLEVEFFLSLIVIRLIL